ncbi:MAG: LytTR family DNA-binding domain-containing protein [Bacteroidota bacterium]
MKTLRAVLVEDEPSGMENLRWKIQNECPDIEIVAECTNGKDAIRAIRRHLPDILFLDILLGDMTGFDVLKEIRHPSFEVVFTTSYDEYALQAIKSSAVDYLLKPVDIDELLDAVAKVRNKLMSQTKTTAPSNTSSKIGLPISTGQQFIDLQDVVYAEAQDNVACVYLSNKKEIKLTKSLGWLEQQLSNQGFCRVHHSFMINFNHLKEYIRNEGGFVVMSNGKAISISRRRKDDFLSRLEQWNLT